MQTDHPPKREHCSSAAGVFQLTWIGPTDGPCSELLERVGQTCALRGRRLRVHTEPLDSALLIPALQSCDSPVIAWADRVIVACQRRLDYPWQILEQLERLDASVPWGVVTGPWHAGSRRTGIGAVAHWQLPWYRWWEGWYGWLFPELARPNARCAAQFEAVMLPIDLATPAMTAAVSPGARPATEPIIELLPGPPRQIVIVAACRDTAEAWQLSAAWVGWDCKHEYPWQASEPMAEADAAIPDCVLWDDSCQDCLPGGDPRLPQACRQIAAIKRRYPDVPIIAGLMEAHLPARPELQRAGASDFLVKPSFGLPLADYLWARLAVETQREQRSQR